MKVDLRTLKPNPLRDFRVDPIDPEAIEKLKHSITEDGFWGGIACRKLPDGEIQIACGHHRVYAAIEAGVTMADVYVGEMDDGDMVLVYGSENATQRGNVGIARTGTVAAALRYLGKHIMMDNVWGITQTFPHMGDMNGKSLETIKGQLQSEKGLGRDLIIRFLRNEKEKGGMPGINQETVKDALVNLKTSGHYARIIAEVRDEIDRENREAQEALEAAERESREAEEREAKARSEREAELARQAKAKAKAKEKDAKEKKAKSDKAKATGEKAADASAKQEVTFDLEGASRYLKLPHHIDVFRDCVTGQGVTPYLPVDRQAELAKSIVDQAKKDGDEISGTYIRRTIVERLMDFKHYQQEENKREKERLMQLSKLEKSREAMRNFSGACRRMVSEGDAIAEIYETWPKDLVFPVTTEFRKAVITAKGVMDTLSAILNERD